MSNVLQKDCVPCYRSKNVGWHDQCAFRPTSSAAGGKVIPRIDTILFFWSGLNSGVSGSGLATVALCSSLNEAVFNRVLVGQFVGEV